MIIRTCGQRNSLAKNRMREICTSGSVGGEGGNVLTYPAILAADSAPDFAALHPGYEKASSELIDFLNRS